MGELRMNAPTQRWESKAANVLKENKPVLNSVGVQTETIVTPTPVRPSFPSGMPKIPVSSQGVGIQTDPEGLLQPIDPAPRVDASVQTWSTGPLEPQTQIVNNNYYNHVTPVSNINTTNQQFVNNQTDQYITNTQIINNQQDVYNQTAVQQDLTVMVNNNLLNLQTHQNNLQQNLTMISDPSLTRPVRPAQQQFNTGTQIVLDQGVMMDLDESELARLEYPNNWVAAQTNPSAVEEPPDSASFTQVARVPGRRARKRKELQDITNVDGPRKKIMYTSR
jgi:hypothetical protein